MGCEPIAGCRYVSLCIILQRRIWKGNKSSIGDRTFATFQDPPLVMYNHILVTETSSIAYW